MLIKTEKDELENYLVDASNLGGGFSDKLFIPETSEEVAEVLREASAKNFSVTVSGARTGTVGGAIPFGGGIISMEKLNRIEKISGSAAIVESGVILNDLQKAAAMENLFYPPDPTEWSCQIGGTAATNASGARSFKYGATRDYIQKLSVVLANGDLLKLKRGEVFALDGLIKLETENGRKIKAKVPTYQMPNVRKNASGYFSAECLDAIDLFIGSEGTLGIITELELKLLPKPENFLSGIVFFQTEKDLLAFVDEAKEISIANRQSPIANKISASVLEYFDENSLDFIREKFPETPENMRGAIMFEQETSAETEDELFEEWNALLEKHDAAVDESWFAAGDQDREKMREFRHALPVAVNERVVKNKQKKISTDMAVPDAMFPNFLKFYKEKLNRSNLEYVIFGHIGDNHLHANILPKNDAEAAQARHLYGRFVAQAIMLGGTISAEHGIGKLKSKYLQVMYGERFINEMAELKKAFDPHGILGRGSVFAEKFLI